MPPDGTCPQCGRPVEEPAVPRSHPGADAAVEDDERAPWHFKLLMAALVIYLGWRLVQLAGAIF
jgi:hypothetical protein